MAEDSNKKFQGGICAGDRKTGQEDIKSSKRVIGKVTNLGGAPTSGKPAGANMENSIKKKGYK
jgi:hypothetical protein